MGAHYGSIHVRTEDAAAIKTAVELISQERNLRFLIAPSIKGWITIFPEQNGQDSTVAELLAAKLANETLIHCLVHDDDVFAYSFFEHGKLVDCYNSRPDYFGEPNPPPRGGNAQAFARLLSKQAKVAQLQALLDAERPTLESNRLEDFAVLLELPNALSAYEYLQDGERDGIRQWKKFVHIPNLSGEKSVKRAAAAKVRTELLRRQ